jgi:hypothetical protein
LFLIVSLKTSSKTFTWLCLIFTLLNALRAECKWFTVLDLKDTFCLKSSDNYFLPLNGQTLGQKPLFSREPVAQTCNPSYTGGRDQKNCVWKPAQDKRETLSQKKPNTKTGLVQLLKWECVCLAKPSKCEALSSSPSIKKKPLKYSLAVLPQGPKNLLKIFWKILTKELRMLQLNQGTLLQYVDDLWLPVQIMSFA